VPELPELEVLRRQAKAELVGRIMDAVTVNQVKAINVSRPEFARRVQGHDIDGVERKGKHLALHLGGDDSLDVHFAMGGALVLRDSAEHDPQHTPFVFAFADGAYLHAIRWQLGHIHVLDTEHLCYANGRLGELGPDAWDDVGSAADLRAAIGDSRAGIKARLMDQETIAGIGNAYSDEILFHARLDPRSSTDALREGDFAAIYEAIREVFGTAIDAGGEGFIDLYGNEGDAQKGFAVHNRGGEACPGDCGGEVAEIRISGRTGYWCPKCQERR